MGWKIFTLTVFLAVWVSLSPVPVQSQDKNIPIHQSWTTDNKLRLLVDRLKRPCREHGTSRDLIALSKYGQAAAPAVLDILPFLECPYPDVRAAAVQALSAIGQAKDVMAYLEKALQDREASVRGSAAEALGRMKAEARETVPSLIRCLKDPNWQVRKASAAALGLIADHTAVIPLIQTLSEPETKPRWQGQQVRSAAAEALGKIGDKRAIQPLLHAVQYDRDIRHTAAEAIKNINVPGELEKADRKLKLNPVLHPVTNGQKQ